MSSTDQFTYNIWQTKNSKYFLAFLPIISVIGIGLATYITTPYGAGVSGDAARNLSTAENLLRGRGFFDLSGKPLIYWPPLYPSLLALLGFFTKGDVFLGGWYLNVLLYGANIFLSGLLFYQIFHKRILYPVIGSLFVFLSVSSFRIHVNIASDPLFITLSLLFFITTHNYMRNNSKTALAGMVAFAALASLQRLIGVSLIAIGCYSIAHKNWQQWKLFIIDNLKFGILSSIPLAAWIYLHNFSKYGAIAGNPYNIFQPLENARVSTLKIIHWFIPFQMIPDLVMEKPWILPAGITLALLIINKQKHWKMLAKDLFSPRVFPLILYFFISFIGLIYTVATPDHKDLESDRYYITALVPVLIISFVVFENLILPHLRIRQNLLEKLLFSAFAIWSIYPLHGLQEFLIESRYSEGITSYNTINTKVIRNSDVIKHLEILPTINSNTALYSNDPGAVWFITRSKIFLLPWLPQEMPFAEDEKERLKNWPPQQAYIIWIKPDIYETTTTPDELSQISQLDLLYSGPDGDIYQVHAKDE